MLSPPLIVVSRTVSPLSLMSTVSVPGCGGSDTGGAVSIVTSAAGSCSICTASGAAAGTGAGVVVGAAASTTVTFLILFGAASKPSRFSRLAYIPLAERKYRPIVVSPLMISLLTLRNLSPALLQYFI